MDESLFHCVICLDLCHECINCLKCHQILCRRHVKNLSENCCPSCRDTPFRFQENIALQRIIRDFRERMGIPQPPPSPHEERLPQGSSSNHQDEDEEEADEAVTTPTSAVGMLPHVLSAASRPEVDERFGSKVPCRGPGMRGQLKKIPSHSHEANMTAHVRTCRHEGCRSVWRGPWGKFIGGANGSTHFDLTECPEGMRLNLLTGWNYEDPRC
eukprot:gnl/MRDRNA2_/MRDRNA2_109176_c0_seq1.p1 gnl/MRDRNA2_/MRDRNA2_109176_c0~~gnl/MRDRNA2_/MRDRNA2_109176_c0_seq1.p1  ORF type:complete len:213 (+),score=17.40 gnl/MRDRNA2_/MRDRNA2_109176_c0_seq1:81-719(+)